MDRSLPLPAIIVNALIERSEKKEKKGKLRASESELESELKMKEKNGQTKWHQIDFNGVK